MRNKIDIYTERYARYRSADRLRQEVFISNETMLVNARVKSVQVACALGAFLHITDIDNKNADRACASSIMPKWLLLLTPDVFDFNNYDTEDYYLLWADAVYAPGGYLDRVNKLTDKTQRSAIFDAAEARILERGACLLSSDQQESYQSVLDFYGYNESDHRASYLFGELRSEKEKSQQFAQIVLEELEIALDSAGV